MNKVTLPGSDREFDYLCVDDFLPDILTARCLGTAFESGLVDYFLERGTVSFEELADRFRADRRGMELLLDQLIAGRVVLRRNGEFLLSEAFLHALAYRDLLELKLELANFCAYDVLSYFPDFVFRPREFAKKSDFYGLFAYDRCSERSEEAVRVARRWMRVTTVLTKYEARACLKYHDFGGCRRILDVGGNSGEFVLRICRSHPGVEAAVFDLPLVCEIGAAHLSGEPEASRISFVKGNALVDVWPGGFDLVSFKSMLHDWPDEAAKELMARAAGALDPGGTVLIFERAPLELDGRPLPYSLVPFLLFHHSYRPPRFYVDHLRALGFGKVEVRKIDLEMPFFLVTGTR
ncbi:MAG: methyltransferase type 12 [Syntrophaceae bacterium]|nr:methyltransferase type 12 [Syntrophaceae bacterium]